MKKQSSNMCSTRLLRIRIFELFTAQAGSRQADAEGTPGSTAWSRRAHFMSAISASQDSRPQLISVQHLTSRQWSAPVRRRLRRPAAQGIAAAAAPDATGPGGPDRHSRWCCSRRSCFRWRIPQRPGQGRRLRRGPLPDTDRLGYSAARAVALGHRQYRCARSGIPVTSSRTLSS